MQANQQPLQEAHNCDFYQHLPVGVPNKTQGTRNGELTPILGTI